MNKNFISLREKGIIVTTRKTRGDDIDAACGQLAVKSIIVCSVD